MGQEQPIFKEEIPLAPTQHLHETASALVNELTVVKITFQIRVLGIDVWREVTVRLDIENIAELAEKLCFKIIFDDYCLA